MRFLRDALLTILILIVILGVAVYAMTRRGLTAEAEPSSVEAVIARRLRTLSIPSDARNLSNPAANQAESWRAGGAHFQDHCAICHDADGHGRGEIGRNLYPKAPDMTRPETQKLADGELFYIIQNGVRWTGMPAWKEEHSPEETWHLVSFVRHLPNLTPEELSQIQSAEGRTHMEGAEEAEHVHEKPGEAHAHADGKPQPKPKPHVHPK
jgi:mono/diheme cytochrome c family protein